MIRGPSTKPVAKLSLNVGSNNIATNAYTQISASLPEPFSFLEIYNPTTKILILAVGAAASEADLPVYIYPSTQPQLIPFDGQIKKGQRLSVKALDASATTGYLILNMYA